MEPFFQHTAPLPSDAGSAHSRSSIHNCNSDDRSTEPRPRRVTAIAGAAAALCVASVIVLSSAAPIQAASEGQPAPPAVGWVAGPTTVDLGGNAQMKLSQSYMFANAADTKKLMEYMQNPPSTDLGLIAPKGRLNDWFIVFDYSPDGYVKDDEKTSLDAGAILQSIKDGTESGNQWRRDRGFAPLNIVGWYEQPHYDTATHNLVWATLGDSGGLQSVNYNTRVLGRYGYMSAVLVTGGPQLDASKREVELLLAGFSWKTGNNYAEYVAGDKVAEIGLTALIAGGAGAAAVKTGLLGKITGLLAPIAKFLAVGALAIAAVFLRGFKSMFRRNPPA